MNRTQRANGAKPTIVKTQSIAGLQCAAKKKCCKRYKKGKPCKRCPLFR